MHGTRRDSQKTLNLVLEPVLPYQLCVSIPCKNPTNFKRTPSSWLLGTSAKTSIMLDAAHVCRETQSSHPPQRHCDELRCACVWRPWTKSTPRSSKQLLLELLVSLTTSYAKLFNFPCIAPNHGCISSLLAETTVYVNVASPFNASRAPLG